MLRYVVPATSPTGEVVGFRLSPNGRQPQLEQLGLLPTDVITAVHAIPLTQPGTGMLALERLSTGEFASITFIRNGNQLAERTVTISLQNEDHTQIVQTWKLLRARIIKHISGPFNAKGTDVAMEELTLAYERLEME